MALLREVSYCPSYTRTCGARVCVQVERYAKAFWEKGSMAFAPADWERHVKNVEKGERKIEEINR